MDKITHKVRCERWTAIINECLASGMNKTAWCRANGISDKAFFYWQKILRQEAYISSVLPTVEKSSLPAENTIDFVELRASESAVTSVQGFRPDIIIRKNGFSLEISNTVSADLLSRIGGFLHAQ